MKLTDLRIEQDTITVVFQGIKAYQALAAILDLRKDIKSLNCERKGNAVKIHCRFYSELDYQTTKETLESI